MCDWRSHLLRKQIKSKNKIFNIFPSHCRRVLFKLQTSSTHQTFVRKAGHTRLEFKLVLMILIALEHVLSLPMIPMIINRMYTCPWNETHRFQCNKKNISENLKLLSSTTQCRYTEFTISAKVCYNFARQNFSPLSSEK